MCILNLTLLLCVNMVNFNIFVVKNIKSLLCFYFDMKHFGGVSLIQIT